MVSHSVKRREFTDRFRGRTHCPVDGPSPPRSWCFLAVCSVEMNSMTGSSSRPIQEAAPWRICHELSLPFDEYPVAKAGARTSGGTICGRISFWLGSKGPRRLGRHRRRRPLPARHGCRVTGVEARSDVREAGVGLFDRSHDKRQVIRESLLGCGPVAERDQFGPDLEPWTWARSPQPASHAAKVR